tara:strand:- start:1136 stop:1624 length:489 start_codon:yes stop_codon:yes gene_type:complete
MMENIKKFGYFCLVIVIGLEIGSVIANISEGKSLFYLFDLSYKFSLDNNLFIPYWGSVIGIVFFIREFESFGQNFKSDQKEEHKIVKKDPIYSGEINVDTGPDQYFWSKNNIDIQLFHLFMYEENKTFKDLHDNTELMINLYRHWLLKYRHKEMKKELEDEQ